MEAREREREREEGGAFAAARESAKSGALNAATRIPDSKEPALYSSSVEETIEERTMGGRRMLGSIAAAAGAALTTTAVGKESFKESFKGFFLCGDNEASVVYCKEEKTSASTIPIPTVECILKDDGIQNVQVDFIVVGAGSAGCALAARLSAAFPELTTLLVEAGEDDEVAEIQTAVDYFGKVERVFGSERDWQFAALPQSNLNSRALYWPRGKVVGGCSSFNTMVFLRGDPSDYDNWAKLLRSSAWSYKSLLPYFARAETYKTGDAISSLGYWHGKDGPITVAPLNHKSHHADDASHHVSRTFVQSAVAVGHRKNNDFASPSGTMGVALNDVNAIGGKRCSASAYLKMRVAALQLDQRVPSILRALLLFGCAPRRKRLFSTLANVNVRWPSTSLFIRARMSMAMNRFAIFASLRGKKLLFAREQYALHGY